MHSILLSASPLQSTTSHSCKVERQGRWYCNVEKVDAEQTTIIQITTWVNRVHNRSVLRKTFKLVLHSRDMTYEFYKLTTIKTISGLLQKFTQDAQISAGRVLIIAWQAKKGKCLRGVYSGPLGKGGGGRILSTITLSPEPIAQDANLSICHANRTRLTCLF